MINDATQTVVKTTTAMMIRRAPELSEFTILTFGGFWSLVTGHFCCLGLTSLGSIERWQDRRFPRAISCR
jgi:hypothetical protein